MVPSEQEAGWGPEPVYMIWRREKSLAPPIIQPQYCPAYSLCKHFCEDTLSCVACYLHNY